MVFVGYSNVYRETDINLAHEIHKFEYNFSPVEFRKECIDDEWSSNHDPMEYNYETPE